MNVIIVGASSGLGQSFAKKYAKNNHLLLMGRKKEFLQKIADNLVVNDKAA